MNQPQLCFDNPQPVRVPEQDTQAGKILRYLRNGGTLTVLEAIEKFGCFALSQRCTDLRRGGWPVVSVMEKLPSGKRIARYSMADAA
jgi:hypothetical protein